MEDNNIAKVLNLANLRLFQENADEEEVENFGPDEDPNWDMFYGPAEYDQPPRFRPGYHQVLEFNRQFCNLKSVPKQLSQMMNLRVLNLSNNNLKTIPDEEFRRLAFLEELDLSFNKLKSIPKYINSPNLRNLNLSHNKFTEVPPVLYNSLPCVSNLDISYNLIESFPRPPLCGNNLERLVLRSNKLNTIPRWIFFQKSLEIIEISNNFLAGIDKNFLNEQALVHLNKTIRVLNMQNCQLTNERLNFISSIPKIEALHCSNSFNMAENRKNRLPILNDRIFTRAKKLKYLFACNVGLLYLNHNFDSLKSIKYVDVSHNHLSWIPDSICNAITLTDIKLNSNAIKYIPADIGKLVNLKKIVLNDNRLVELPESFKYLVNLEICDLYNNELETVSPEIINIKSLKGLDLEVNCLDFKEIFPEEEDFAEFRKRYSVLKAYYHKNYALTRLDLQNPKRKKPEKGDTKQRVIPDFVCDAKSQVYSLRADTQMANLEKYKPHNAEGASNLEDASAAFSQGKLALSSCRGRHSPSGSKAKSEKEELDLD